MDDNTVANRSFLFTATSNYLDEPAPTGLRINMGAYGFSTGDTNFNPDADINRDGTVDHNDLFMLAGEFGRIDCPVCP